MCQWCGDVEEFVNGVRDVEECANGVVMWVVVCQWCGDVEECANGVGDVSSGVPMVCVMWRSV